MFSNKTKVTETEKITNQPSLIDIDSSQSYLEALVNHSVNYQNHIPSGQENAAIRICVTVDKEIIYEPVVSLCMFEKFELYITKEKFDQTKIEEGGYNIFITPNNSKFIQRSPVLIKTVDASTYSDKSLWMNQFKVFNKWGRVSELTVSQELKLKYDLGYIETNKINFNLFEINNCMDSPRKLLPFEIYNMVQRDLKGVNFLPKRTYFDIINELEEAKYSGSDSSTDNRTGNIMIAIEKLRADGEVEGLNDFIAYLTREYDLQTAGIVEYDDVITQIVSYLL